PLPPTSHPMPQPHTLYPCPQEEELRTSGDPKFGHLAEDLHVEVTAVAPPAEAHARLAYALTEIRRYLVPDYNDEIRQRQMREMQLLNSSAGSLAANTGNSKENKGTLADQDDSTNNMITESEEGSLSPDVSGSSPSSGGKGVSRALSIMPHHPALRGINGTGANMLPSIQMLLNLIYI
ncbi:K domain type 1, partial [Trinorchestia longiramus]